jgi:hypothetical protein
MLRKGMMFAALLLLPAVASAQIRGPFELTFGASAVNSSRFDGFSAAGDASLGYFLTDQLEVGIRQTVTYNDVVSPRILDASTAAAVDFHFPLGERNEFMPFIGANLGYIYGSGVKNTFEGAPEGGLKYFVNNTTFLFVQVEYQFFFRKGSGIGNGFKDGQFVYTGGIGFRF